MHDNTRAVPNAVMIGNHPKRGNEQEREREMNEREHERERETEVDYIDRSSGT